jgi:hypothetical protein
VTNLDHLPADKADALTLTPERCRDEATQIGSATLQVVQQLLDEQPLDRLRSVRKLLRLAQTYTPLRLEQACARALRFETVIYVSVKQILQNGLEADETPTAIPAPDWPQFARTPRELLAGGV